MISTQRLSFALRERIARLVIRLSQPDLGAAQREEFAENAFRDDKLTHAALHHVLVEDCGAPVTIFAFASSALLFAAQPTFEFRGLLQPKQGVCNLVFLRDPYRTAYHVTPNGAPHGLAFYEEEVRRLMQSLGGKVHIAIGDSSGGAAALYFGTRCGMDRIIAFNVPFPISFWTSPGAYWHALTNLRLLRRSRYEYWEVCFLTFTTTIVRLQLWATAGRNGTMNPLATYLSTAERPQATLFYGQDCGPDAAIAAQFATAPEARLVPLPTALHNCAVCLAKRGQLRQVIENEIAEAMRQPGTGPSAFNAE
ncbi:MAG: hypothetical protein HYV26_20025 [Candidatus Hydrogenedentes bacterium]|nr:hypothetical protein [Candidatus Hydrogenedentota bacterium]MBI3119137.1 hypothetical protein [Candidatus Hydrogenedentota bacterium]